MQYTILQSRFVFPPVSLREVPALEVSDRQVDTIKISSTFVHGFFFFLPPMATTNHYYQPWIVYIDLSLIYYSHLPDVSLK